MTASPGDGHPQNHPAEDSDGASSSADETVPAEPLVTPDGRYLVVRGRLWRRSDPNLAPDERTRLVDELMHARRAKKAAMAAADERARESARERVDQAKRALGERGPVWWEGGDPDLTRHLVRNTPYAEWYAHHER